MDFKSLLPNFSEIAKTDWSKPSLDSKDTLGVAAMLSVVLMIIFTFLNWYEVDLGVLGKVEDTGIDVYCGVIGLIAALIAGVGVLYGHYSLVFTAAVIALIFGIDGMTLAPEDEDAREYIKNADIEIKHTGAVLFTIASVVTGLIAYVKINKK